MVLLVIVGILVAVMAFALGFFTAILLATSRASRRVDLPVPDTFRIR
jgi:hypothetical protein